MRRALDEYGGHSSVLQPALYKILETLLKRILRTFAKHMSVALPHCQSRNLHRLRGGHDSSDYHNVGKGYDFVPWPSFPVIRFRLVLSCLCWANQDYRVTAQKGSAKLSRDFTVCPFFGVVKHNVNVNVECP